MTHALASYLLLGNFNTAAIADDAFVTNAFIFSAMTFPIFHGTENPLAEQPSHFRLVRSVVDRFRLRYFTVRAFQNRFRRSQADGDLGEVVVDLFIFSE